MRRDLRSEVYVWEDISMNTRFRWPGSCDVARGVDEPVVVGLVCRGLPSMRRNRWDRRMGAVESKKGASAPRIPNSAGANNGQKWPSDGSSLWCGRARPASCQAFEKHWRLWRNKRLIPCDRRLHVD